MGNSHAWVVRLRTHARSRSARHAGKISAHLAWMHPNSTHSCTPGRLGDLLRHRQCFIDGDRATCDAGGQRLAFDQFDDERANTLALLETIDGGDVRMVERSQDFGLALKTRQAIGTSQTTRAGSSARRRASTADRERDTPRPFPRHQACRRSRTRRAACRPQASCHSAIDARGTESAEFTASSSN
jgi:hypothetical protein